MAKLLMHMKKSGTMRCMMRHDQTVEDCGQFLRHRCSHALQTEAFYCCSGKSWEVVVFDCASGEPEAQLALKLDRCDEHYYILGGHVRLGRRVIVFNCSSWGRDGSSCWCRSGHSPLTVASELVVSLKNHHTAYNVSLFTVLLAATAATATPTCCLCTSGRKNGRLFIVSLMEKNVKLSTPLFCTHIRWRLRSAKGICSVDPDCTLHSRNWWLNRLRQWG